MLPTRPTAETAAAEPRSPEPSRRRSRYRAPEEVAPASDVGTAGLAPASWALSPSEEKLTALWPATHGRVAARMAEMGPTEGAMDGEVWVFSTPSVTAAASPDQ